MITINIQREERRRAYIYILTWNNKPIFNSNILSVNVANLLIYTYYNNNAYEKRSSKLKLNDEFFCSLFGVNSLESNLE